MKCISWNVRGLRDERRRGIVGRYLREWGADIMSSGDDAGPARAAILDDTRMGKRGGSCRY